ncbi:MAG: oxygen-insensitive NADPH nitroreductase [Holophaga sp.]|nr:oxygen-insensitive NADPH nitroreductase [Holophaga sp.]
MNDVIALLQAHRSIRKFKPEPVPDAQIEEIVRCGQAAATSSNMQATTIIRVRDGAMRQKLAELAGGQPYVASAGAFLVFCADLHRTRLACELRGGDFSSELTEQFIVATVDVALAAQNCVVAAESLGLGICYIGGLRNNPQAVADLLELPESVYPVFGLCLGQPDQDPEVKPRLPLSAVLQEDRYRDAGARAGIERYDQQLRDYYRTRSGGRKDSTWSEEMKSLAGKSRPHMREFLARRGFALK